MRFYRHMLLIKLNYSDTKEKQYLQILYKISNLMKNETLENEHAYCLIPITYVNYISQESSDRLLIIYNVQIPLFQFTFIWIAVPRYVHVCWWVFLTGSRILR